jgi:hypothetical protein
MPLALLASIMNLVAGSAVCRATNFMINRVGAATASD